MVLAASKLKAEVAIQSILEKHIILRTSWAFSLRGKNFLTTMLRLFNEKKAISVIDDQIGAPTWSRSIAEITAVVLGFVIKEECDTWGLYHLSAGGAVSWYDFSLAICESITLQHQLVVNPIRTAQYNQHATRPLNSLLSNKRLESVFGVRQTEWMKSLFLCLEK